MKNFYGLKIEENSLAGKKSYNKIIYSDSTANALLDCITLIVKEYIDKTPSFDVTFFDAKTIMLRWDIPYYCTEIIVSIIEEKTI
jgi:hypothetical protein